MSRQILFTIKLPSRVHCVNRYIDVYEGYPNDIKYVNVKFVDSYNDPIMTITAKRADDMIAALNKIKEHLAE